MKVGAGVFDVLLAHGSVWTTSHDTGVIARSDTSTGLSTRIYRDGPKPVALAACGGRIWVGHGRPATWVTSIEPRRHRIRRVSTVVEGPRAPTCIDGVVWVTTEDSVVRIDARTGRLLTVLKVGETLGEAAAGPDGLVWVTDKQHSTIHRLTPDGRHVLDTFAAGPGAFALARAGRTMWVSSFAGSDVRSFVP
jgi:streptogramin lyase